MRNFVEKAKAINTVKSKATLLVFALLQVFILYIIKNH